jgi:hypothetical protein
MDLEGFFSYQFARHQHHLVCLKDGRVSDWVGSFEGSRRQSLLARNGATYNLRAGFDASKKDFLTFYKG